MKPQIGIWWDNGQVIVAFPVSAGIADPETGMCDSDDAHNDCWPEAAMRLRARRDDEYFSVPRGRVLYHPKRQKSIIYHGNQTSTVRLQLIAAEFALENWEARLDGHYMMGPAADQFFDEE
jgi:hypothetical protein